MKPLFLRLTITFWLLFLFLVFSIGVSIYFEYEQDFSRKIVAIDQYISNIGERMTTELKRIQELQEVFISGIEEAYEQSLAIYEQLSNEELIRLLNDNDSAMKSREEMIQELTYRHITVNLNHDIFQQINGLGVDNFSFLSQDSIDSVFSETNVQCQTRENYENSLFCTKIHNEEESYKFYLAESIELGDRVIGYVVVELVSILNFIHEFENNVYYLSETIKIFPDKLFEPQDKTSAQRSDEVDFSQNYGRLAFNEFFTEEDDFFEESTLEEATRILRDNGYHVSIYNLDEIENYKILNFTSLRDIRLTVIRELLTIFKISVFLSIFFLAIVFYFVFKSMIQPCYLLVDYVKRCGERDYLMVPNLNNRWRLTFLNVRNVYLEKERLLAEKDNQSEELQVAWKRAIDASKAKSHFLTKISHELKTPLNAIKGYAQLLRRSVKDEKQKKQVDVIHHSSELLLKLVNELLDFSILEEGKVKLQINNFDLHIVAHEIEELFAIQASSKKLDFKVKVDQEVPNHLYGDCNRIKQVVINLISNAIKFTEHGSIKINFDLDYQNETDAYIKIKVEDTGKGIEESKFSTVFESFTQENDTISQHFGGTGLGLSISKQLAEIMGGNLTLESKVNVGSTFTFFLPLSKVSVEERRS